MTSVLQVELERKQAKAKNWRKKNVRLNWLCEPGSLLKTATTFFTTEKVIQGKAEVTKEPAKKEEEWINLQFACLELKAGLNFARSQIPRHLKKINAPKSVSRSIRTTVAPGLPVLDPGSQI